MNNEKYLAIRQNIVDTWTRDPEDDDEVEVARELGIEEAQHQAMLEEQYAAQCV